MNGNPIFDNVTLGYSQELNLSHSTPNSTANQLVGLLLGLSLECMCFLRCYISIGCFQILGRSVVRGKTSLCRNYHNLEMRALVSNLRWITKPGVF